MKGSAVFFDRDGTINEEVGYLSRREQLVLCPGAAQAVRMVNERAMPAVVVTNQSGIARGLFDAVFLETLHAEINGMLRVAEGAWIDRFYYCPHHPLEGGGPYTRPCDCRKPEPGMLLRAARELCIDLDRSYLVGDTLRDMEAARRAGVRGILVTTGYGAREPRSDLPVHVAVDVLDAVKWILRDLPP